MPLNRKKHHGTRNKIIIFAIAAVLIALMIISFSPVREVTEIVLYP